MENLLIPYQATFLIPAKGALVLAPHPDDEVFGCGGAIMRHIEQGVPVHVVVVSDGGYGVEAASRDDYVRQRQAESIAAGERLGYGVPIFWAYRDREVSYGEKLVLEIAAAIQSAKADLVYAPSMLEMHPDHRALAMAAIEAVRRAGDGVRLALYEVGVPLQPNVLLDITGLADRKMAAMGCFFSQLTKQRYDLDVAALNRYRSYTLPASVTAAEAFAVFDAAALMQDPLRLHQSEYARQDKLGMMLDIGDAPLVSVIIRSMDRPSLSDALDSVALQTYPHIEVVLVDALGNHRDMGAWCGRFPLRMAGKGKSLQRGGAANAGLDAAKGDYLIFLDDDDWFEADHIARLVREIQAHPEVRVVYSGVKCIDAEGKSLATQFATPFDATQLVAGNYIPIHAALFARTLLDAGCRVDESFDVYEDWDFWVQASRFTDFLFIGGFTAVYRITEQAGFGVHADRSKAEAASAKLFNKWVPRLNDGQLLELMHAVRLVRTRDQQLAELHGHIDNLRKALTDKDALIQERDALVQEKDRQIQSVASSLQQVLSSNSWKLTRPVRRLMEATQSMRRRLAELRQMLKRNGGLFGLANTMFLIVKKDGFGELLSRVARFVRGNPSHHPDNNSYQEWVERYDTLGATDRKRIVAAIEAMTSRPKISVLMPVYNPPLDFLDEAIASVRKQLYPDWELCIADDASGDPAVRELLARHAAEDTRIRVVYREQNGHISRASNSALELATGEFVALFDNDDLLPEHALYCIAQAIHDHPDAALVYSDEDKIDSTSRRHAPYFKPDWNPDLFLSHNMICHLGAYRTSLVRALDGFRTGFEGAQDYDLALRCIEQIAPGQIVHIPRVLYHWRSHPGSTALAGSEKNYALLAGERALNDHLQRMGVAAKAELLEFGMYRVRYATPSPLPMVSLIIPTRNGLKLIRMCVESILSRTLYPNYEIIIVDNGSDEPETLQYLASLSGDARVRVLRDERPFNYAALNNGAISHARGEYVALINNDIEVLSPDWLDEMIGLAAQPGVGAVGARLWYPNDTLQHGGVILGVGGVAGHSHKHLPKGDLGYFARAGLTQTLSAVTAACLVVRKDIYTQVGGLDEANLKVAFNDIDFCLKVRSAGYRNVWTPYAELYHHESATRGYEDTPEKQARFMQEVLYMQSRWKDALGFDPAYNPNLTLEWEDFGLAWPPRVAPLPDISVRA